MRRRRLTLVAVAVLVVPALAAAFPGQAACALIDLGPLDGDSGVLFERSLSGNERLAALAALTEARSRLSARLGLSSTQTRLVFLDDGRSLWPFSFNEYGSTHFIGTRACMVVGREGRNVDVVAHELTHGALFEWLGAWNRERLPTWFDEGLAMQVDDRAPYQGAAVDEGVRALTRPGSFFVEPLTGHYAAARALVAAWRGTLTAREWVVVLERLRDGESVDQVWPAAGTAR